MRKHLTHRRDASNPSMVYTESGVYHCSLSSWCCTRNTGVHMSKAKLPPRGASSQQRQAVGVGAVVLSGADRDATMEELASVGVRASRV